jgi:hypothetical protein
MTRLACAAAALLAGRLRDRRQGAMRPATFGPAISIEATMKEVTRLLVRR